MIIVFVLFVLFGIVLALKRPNAFVVFYLLSSSKFLGFFDIDYLFVFSDTGVGTPALNAITFLGALLSGGLWRASRHYRNFMLAISAFFLYGVSLPVIAGLETLYQASVASKELWAMAFFFYLVSYRFVIDVKRILDTVKYIGLYLAFAYVVYDLSGLGAPFYITPDLYTGAQVFRGFFPTYMSVALFVYYSELQDREISSLRFFLAALVLFLGMILSGYTSLVGATGASFLLLYIFFRKTKFSLGLLIKRSTIVLAFGVVAIIGSPQLRDGLSEKFELILEGKDPALTSRDTYNQFRWDAINSRPLTGYGFIHKSAPITQNAIQINDNRFAERFEVIDSGYVDLLIKFGYFGVALYLTIWGRVIYKVIKNSQRFLVIQIAMAFYLLQYFAISYTWSVFTFAHGLIPGFLAAFVVLARFGGEKRG